MQLLSHREAWNGLPLALFLLALLADVPARAQDAHYWSHQYGSREALLGGAVIGSAEGLPATYYNPARIGRGAQNSFALSTYAFGWETLTVEDGVSPGVDLASTRSGLEPSLIAGSLPWGGERHLWAYSILSRRVVDADIGSSLVRENASPTLPLAVATLRLENQLHDYWGGLTWACSLGSGLAVGASGYVAYTSADRRTEVLIEGLDTNGQGLAIVDERGYEFWHTRVLAKLGLWYGLDGIDLGLTVTTPSLRITGTGKTGGNVGVFGTPSDDQLHAVVYDGLDANYRSPFSVGVGGAWSIGVTRIHASCEWFAALDPYRAVDSDTFGPPDNPYSIDAVHAADSVFNWGLAFEHRFSQKFEGFVSYAVNNSAATGDDTNLGTSFYSIDMVTAGTRAELPWMKLTLGIGYAFGRTPLDDIADFTDIDGGPFAVVGEATTLRYRKWELLFGFEF
jgi:hypothetical protein